ARNLPAESKLHKMPAWIQQKIALIFESYPGADLSILACLIAAKGVQQTNPPEALRFFLKGQSEGGKSAHVELAAEICCDRASLKNLVREQEDLFRNVGSAADEVTFLFFDEIAKQYEDKKVDVRAVILNIKRGLRWRPLYGTRRTMHNTPELVLGDTDVMDGLKSDDQISRRIYCKDLGAGIQAFAKPGGKIKWFDTGGDIKGWRSRYLPHREAADALTAFIIDTYRGMTMPEIAADCGFVL